MKQYNELTQKLLKEAYTARHFPEYVQIDTSRLPGDDPLNNLSGGFEYKRWYSDEIVYRTGCGMFVMGRNVLDHMAYMGIDWSHENNNPVILCPFYKADCRDNDSRLHDAQGERGRQLVFCSCHRTDLPYDFENSIEKVDKERWEEKERRYEEYAAARNGRICRHHMYYNERSREWHLRYSPRLCADLCHENVYCPVLGKKLSRKRGNVYYDIKTSGVYRQEGSQISLLDGTSWTNIRKACRFFRHPCSMDICEAFVRLESAKIQETCHSNLSLGTDPSWKIEILNIRAESRPSRDLRQDLEDIRAGIDIIFDPDAEKNAAERKKETKAAAKRKRLEKLERKILDKGYAGLGEYTADRIHADKWLTQERIAELEQLRQERMRKPVQMTLEDYEDGL